MMRAPVPPVIIGVLLPRFRDRESLLIQMHILRRARAEVLRASIRMVRHLRLAHLLPDFGHEYLVQLAAESTLGEGGPKLIPRMSILGFHVTYDVIESGPSAQAFVALRAIFAAVHLGLMPHRHRLSVGIALGAKTRDRHVTIHQRAVAESVAPPEVRTHRVLHKGLIARLADHIFWIPVGAIIHI